MEFKILTIALFLGFIFISPVFAEQVTPLTARSNPQINILKNLDFKTFFMHFYQKDIRHLKMNQQQDIPSVGIRSASGKILYTVYNPVQIYQNLNGEKRYIVWIEMFDQENGEIITGHPSRPKVELYLFKKRTDGQFQLLSRTRPTLDISGSWGESHLNAVDFKKIKQVGKAQMGFNYSGGYTATGSHTESEFMIVLNEQGWIEEYPFGVSESNAGAHEEGDPEYGGYSKTYSLIKDPNADSLFPIKIEYLQYGKMDWIDHFPKDGTVEVVHFNFGKNCFMNSKNTCNTDFSDN